MNITHIEGDCSAFGAADSQYQTQSSVYFVGIQNQQHTATIGVNAWININIFVKCFRFEDVMRLHTLGTYLSLIFINCHTSIQTIGSIILTTISHIHNWYFHFETRICCEFNKTQGCVSAVKMVTKETDSFWTSWTHRLFINFCLFIETWVMPNLCLQGPVGVIPVIVLWMSQKWRYQSRPVMHLKVTSLTILHYHKSNFILVQWWNMLATSFAQIWSFSTNVCIAVHQPQYIWLKLVQKWVFCCQLCCRIILCHAGCSVAGVSPQ